MHACTALIDNAIKKPTKDVGFPGANVCYRKLVLSYAILCCDSVLQT